MYGFDLTAQQLTLVMIFLGCWLSSALSKSELECSHLDFILIAQKCAHFVSLGDKLKLAHTIYSLDWQTDLGIVDCSLVMNSFYLQECWIFFSCGSTCSNCVHYNFGRFACFFDLVFSAVLVGFAGWNGLPYFFCCESFVRFGCVASNLFSFQIIGLHPNFRKSFNH